MIMQLRARIASFPLPHPAIFKAYDIRGVLGVSLDDSVAYQIGQAFGSASVMASASSSSATTAASPGRRWQQRSRQVCSQPGSM